jgi:phosphoglycerol transferase MdoB-like AlkP superfamily enzyme
VTEPSSSPRRRVVEACLPGLARTGALALGCNLALELTQLTGVDGWPWMQKTPTYALMFLLGSLVLWLVVGLVHAVVGRFTVTVALAVGATAVVAVADYEKVRLRREPVYPSDWEFVRDAGFLTDMIGVRVVVLLVLGILVSAAAAIVGVRLLRRRLANREVRTRPPQSRRARAALRLLTGALCLLSLGYIAQFNSPGNAARGAYDVLGAAWRPWSQQRNYLGNGFVGGFLYNLGVPPVATPAGYSASTMAEVTARYTAAAERINSARDPQGLDDVNVVMILSESFSDPEALRGVHPARDPIPFTRRLMRSTMSGRMLAQNVGGGTANMEFEALTGMSLSNFPPQVRVPYQMLIPEHATFPSVVRWFEQHGHRAVAIHPFTTEMYRRREVYPILGFDDFVYDRKMHDRRRIGHGAYISDAAAFHEVQRTITAERAPVFVNLVTMQNHVPYAGKYDHPIRVTDPDGEVMPGISEYTRGLAYTDRALASLIAGLRHSAEKTVVVFYGDHLPGVYSDAAFAANRPRAVHSTPFFVWANFGVPGGTQPTTSPIHFMDLVLQRAGAAVPPYYALLDELRRAVPAMDSGIYVDARDRRVRRDQLSGRALRLLEDYRLVQYDLAVGKRYSARAMFGDTTLRAHGR